MLNSTFSSGKLQETAQHDSHFLMPVSHMGDRIQSFKVRKLIGWEKSSSLERYSKSCVYKQSKDLIYCFPWALRGSATSREAGLIVCNCFLGRQAISFQISLTSSLLSPGFLAEYDIIWYGTFLWSFGVICSDTSLLSLLCTPSHTLSGQRELKKSTSLQDLLSNN